MPRPVVAVDFDGTLMHHDEDGRCFVVPGAREALVRLKQTGAKIIIHTCRTGIAEVNGTLVDVVA
jgi:hydroxymethylpyrimidine pyrophosphatase-like HAD family hydrolase